MFAKSHGKCSNWTRFSQLFGQNKYKCNQTPLFTWKILNIQDFPSINVAKMNYTMGQFGNKIDEVVPNLAIHTLRLLNAMFD